MTPHVIFVCGFARSGSTLLGDLLGSAEGVFHAGEVAHLRRRLLKNGSCSCGLRLWECPIWGSVLASIDPEGAQQRRPSITLLESLWPTGNDPSRTAATLRQICHALSLATNCETIVDSSKLPAYGPIVEVATEGNWSVIHLIRDGRAAVNARLRKTNERRDISQARRFALTISEANAWNKANIRAATVAKGVDHAMLIKYEELVNDPVGLVNRILRPLGHEAPPHWSNDEITIPARHVVWGNTKARPGEVNVKPDLRWLEEMGQIERIVVSAIEAPVLRHHGYAFRSPRRDQP